LRRARSVLPLSAFGDYWLVNSFEILLGDKVISEVFFDHGVRHIISATVFRSMIACLTLGRRRREGKGLPALFEALFSGNLTV